MQLFNYNYLNRVLGHQQGEVLEIQSDRITMKTATRRRIEILDVQKDELFHNHRTVRAAMTMTMMKKQVSQAFRHEVEFESQQQKQEVSIEDCKSIFRQKKNFPSNSVSNRTHFAIFLIFLLSKNVNIFFLSYNYS